MSQSRDLPLPQDKTGGVAGNGGKSTSGTNAEGILECYGHKILRGDDPKCAQCEWLTSCTYYTSENLGSRSREIHYRDYMAIPFDKVGGLEIEKAMEDALLNRKDVFRTSDGKEFDLSGINVEPYGSPLSSLRRCRLLRSSLIPGSSPLTTWPPYSEPQGSFSTGT